RSITSDLRNVSLLRRIVGSAFPGLDTRALVEELAERLEEEIDYGLEGRSQELFASYYESHPYIHVPHVVPELSTARVLTSELVSGSRFEEMQAWSQHERDLAAETIYR
ncbi:MAG: AarF/ABC1/UbiB kinase family protein, partial [Chloroflexi bacterium]